MKNRITLKVSEIALNLNNPRHGPLKDQNAAIEHLCNEEKIIPLAQDIAEHGINPLELFAVTKDKNGKYYCVEGNRRLCAIKLLNNPDLAPLGFRKKLKEIVASTNWIPISHLDVVPFLNEQEVDLWLDRIHNGENKGRGRRQWAAEQKARHSTQSENKLALQILDIAQKRGYISAADRKSKISIVARFLKVAIMRNVFGLITNDGVSYTTNLSKTDFEILFEKFMKDLIKQKITTRDNKAEIEKYANSLTKTKGFKGRKVSKRNLVDGLPAKIKGTTTTSPKKIKPNIKFSKAVEDALVAIPNYKLSNLYHSICTVDLSVHTPLIVIGIWTFLETLTSLCGRKTGNSFPSYLSADKLQKLGLGDKKETKSLRDVIQEISDNGNTTKHHKKAATFNEEQVANNFDTVEDLIIKLAKKAKGK